MGAALVVGSDSMIGHSLIDYLNRLGVPVIGTTRRCEKVTASNVFLDLSAVASTWPCPESVDVAVLCAGSAQIEECEKNPEKTRLVNVAGLSALADILMSRRVFVVFLSSSTVFDGTLPFRKPEDTVAPRTEYGRQKVAMEQFLLKSSRPSAIIRLTKTLSPDFPLIRKWARQLRDGEPIHPFYDMTMSPVSLTFVTGVLYRLLENRASGVWHVSGNLDITYEAAARYIARRIGADVNQIHPISAHSALGDHVFIPEYTSLETGRLSRELSLSSPDVWRSMDTVLHQ